MIAAGTDTISWPPIRQASDGEWWWVRPIPLMDGQPFGYDMHVTEHPMLNDEGREVLVLCTFRFQIGQASKMRWACGHADIELCYRCIHPVGGDGAEKAHDGPHVAASKEDLVRFHDTYGEHAVILSIERHTPMRLPEVPLL